MHNVVYMYLQHDVVVDWRKEKDIYCSPPKMRYNVGVDYTLYEAHLKCIDDEQCTGFTSLDCQGYDSNFYLCMMDKDIRKSIEKVGLEYSGFGCMYLKPGNVLHNYLTVFLTYNVLNYIL